MEKIKENKKLIIIIVAAVAVVIALFFGIKALIPENTPSNEKAKRSTPEVLTLDEKEVEEVTAITGTAKDKKGIEDKEGHRIYDTGYKNKNGDTIYTTGKKDAKGNVLYTLNKTDDVGKLIYYTGTVSQTDKTTMDLVKTNTIPDYTSNKNSTLTNGSRYTTTKTIELKTEKDEVVAEAVSSNFISYSGGTKEDLFNKVVAVKNGYVAVGNSSSKDGIYTSADSSWKDFFGSVSKISEDGKFEWTYTLGGDKLVAFYDAAELEDGSIVAVGLTTATEGKAVKTGISNASVIVKLDKKGNEIWSYSFPCDEEENGDEARCVAATPDGGFVVGGEADSTTGFFKDAEGKYKAYIFKFDKKGNIEWKKILSGSMDNTITALAVNDDGKIFATCVTHSYDGNFGYLSEYKTSGNTPNTVVLKLDKKGDLEWSETLAGWGRSEFDSIDVTPDGGCVIGGTMSIVKRANGSFSQCYGSTDGYVVRYSEDGEVYWAHNIGGTEADSVKGVAYTDEGIVVVGTTYSTNYDFAGLISSGDKDSFVTVLNNAGNVVFTNLLGGSGNDTANSVCAAEKGVAIAGFTTSADGIFKDSNSNKKATAFITTYDFSDK